MLSDSNARLAAARRLTDRRGRREAGRFLAEGAQAVREALRRPGAVVEVFATAAALDRHRDLLGPLDIPVDEVSVRAAAALSETVTPQGLVAVCRRLDVPLADALGRRPRLVAALVDASEPGNVGAVIRTADAAGADAVVLAGETADVYNGKAVRASAGSLFHLDVVLGGDPREVIDRGCDAGLATLATTRQGGTELDSVDLHRRTLWLFGNEAHGLPDDVIAAADHAVRVPIYGAAESLNLAAAAAVCLYASARAQRG